MKAAFAVTTGGQPDAPLVESARTAAAAWGVPCLARGRKEPLSRLFEHAGSLLVMGKDGARLWDRSGSLRWSPGMAALRIKAIDAGRAEDMLVRVGELAAGDAVLDCTLGLAQDALVAARVAGSTGRVVGLEASLPLFAATSEGLRRMGPLPHSCAVEPIYARAAEWLAAHSGTRFDVILFDPMFERTQGSSGTFEVMRRYADPSPLTVEMLERACTMARRWVVVKGARYSTDFSKLGLEPLPRGRLAQVAWARARGTG